MRPKACQKLDRPSKQGRGRCRVPNAPAAWCAHIELSMHTSIHSGSTGIIRHPPRNGFTAYSALSPGTNCFVDPVIRATRWRPRELDACIGAPEPHGFAVRKQARSSVAPPASTASHPTFVTIASRPSWQGRMAQANHIFLKNGSKLFFVRGLDSNSQAPPVGQISCSDKHESGCGAEVCHPLPNRSVAARGGMKNSLTPVSQPNYRSPLRYGPR